MNGQTCRIKVNMNGERWNHAIVLAAPLFIGMMHAPATWAQAPAAPTAGAGGQESTGRDDQEGDHLRRVVRHAGAAELARQ